MLPSHVEELDDDDDDDDDDVELVELVKELAQRDGQCVKRKTGCISEQTSTETMSGDRFDEALHRFQQENGKEELWISLCN